MRYRLFLLALLTTLIAPLRAETEKVPSGIETEAEGVVLQKSDSRLIVRRHGGSQVEVVLTPSTEIVEKKINPFRGATDFSPETLVPGLNVRVEGVGDMNGAILAQKIRFTKDELKVARTISSRVVPVEERLSVTEKELSRTQSELETSTSELNSRADSLQGRVEELDDAFQLARSEARSAQETAEQAFGRASANEARFGDLDQYREQELVTVQFPFNSAELTQEGRQRLDQLADRLVNEDGFILEVVGYTSSDGDPAYNRSLSERRSEAVIAYLAEEHTIPLRRIIRPYGFGEKSPVADNSTRSGRQQNRRVEVRVLQNVGITAESSSAGLKGQEELKTVSMNEE